MHQFHHSDYKWPIEVRVTTNVFDSGSLLRRAPSRNHQASRGTTFFWQLPPPAAMSGFRHQVRRRSQSPWADRPHCKQPALRASSKPCTAERCKTRAPPITTLVQSNTCRLITGKPTGHSRLLNEQPTAFCKPQRLLRKSSLRQPAQQAMPVSRPAAECLFNQELYTLLVFQESCSESSFLPFPFFLSPARSNQFISPPLFHHTTCLSLTLDKSDSKLMLLQE